MSRNCPFNSTMLGHNSASSGALSLKSWKDPRYTPSLLTTLNIAPQWSCYSLLPPPLRWRQHQKGTHKTQPIWPMKHELHSLDKNRKLSSFIIRHSTAQHRKLKLEATVGFKYSSKQERGFPLLLWERLKEVGLAMTKDIKSPTSLSNSNPSRQLFKQ